MSPFKGLPHFTLDVGDCDLAAIPDARLRGLAQYWFARRAKDGVPRRSAIDPLDLAGLLPNLILLDRLPGAAKADATTADIGRFRFRLAGTAVTQAVGQELTGRFLDEMLPPGYLDYVLLLNHLALQRCLPVYSSSLFHDEGNIVNGLTYRLVMPLRRADGNEGGAAPDTIFVCQFWQHRETGGFWDGDWRSVRPEIQVVRP